MAKTEYKHIERPSHPEIQDSQTVKNSRPILTGIISQWEYVNKYS